MYPGPVIGRSLHSKNQLSAVCKLVHSHNLRRSCLDVATMSWNCWQTLRAVKIDLIGISRKICSNSSAVLNTALRAASTVISLVIRMLSGFSVLAVTFRALYEGMLSATPLYNNGRQSTAGGCTMSRTHFSAFAFSNVLCFAFLCRHVEVLPSP